MRKSGWEIGGLCFLLSLAIGCGEGPAYIPVSGTVYYNDKPVSSGVVMFQPAVGEVARGPIQADGTYTLETLGESAGVEPGVAKVRVSVREAPKMYGGEIGLGRLLIPERYTDFDLSGLTFDVSPDGGETYDIHLTDSR